MDDACPGKGAVALPAVPTCQVCGEPLAGRAVVQCSKCATPHHLECWRFNKGCSMYGCGSRSSEKPVTELEAGLTGRFTLTSDLPTAERIQPMETVGILAIVGVIAAGTFTGSPLLFMGGLVAFLLAAVGVTVRDMGCVQRLVVDVDGKNVERSVLLMGRELRRIPAWLDLDQVAELHVYRDVEGGRAGMGRIRRRIDALLVDGSVRTVYARTAVGGADRPDEVTSAAERLAAAADCTVRTFDDGARPTAAELTDAVAQRRVELADAEQRALTGGDDEAPLQLPESPPEP